MRVTPTTTHQLMLDGLQSAITRVQKAQGELSSGKRINVYSDAPADAATTLRLRAEESDWKSYAKAADDGTAWLNTQDQALQSITTLLHRVRELALDGATSTNNATAREAMAVEIDGIREQIAGLANSTYQGQHVFAGFGAAAVTQVGGNWAWSGDNGAVMRRVTPDVLVQVNGDGQAIFGFGAGQTNIFATLTQVASDLRSGNSSSLGGADLNLIDAAASNVSKGLSVAGARASLVESAKSTGSAQIAVLKDTRSSLEDIDVAEAALNMQVAQTGYQAALAAAARMDLPTLADFLR